MTVGEEVFLQQILEDRDRLFREKSRLQSQLASYQDFESERTLYQQLILKISNLKTGQNWSRKSQKFWNATLPAGMYAGLFATNMY